MTTSNMFVANYSLMADVDAERDDHAISDLDDLDDQEAMECLSNPHLVAILDGLPKDIVDVQELTKKNGQVDLTPYGHEVMARYVEALKGLVPDLKDNDPIV